ATSIRPGLIVELRTSGCVNELHRRRIRGQLQSSAQASLVLPTSLGDLRSDFDREVAQLNRCRRPWRGRGVLGGGLTLGDVSCGVESARELRIEQCGFQRSAPLENGLPDVLIGEKIDGWPPEHCWLASSGLDHETKVAEDLVVENGQRVAV